MMHENRTMKECKYLVVLLDRDGFEISSRPAGTLKEAKSEARHMLSDDYARAGETTHENMQTGKVEILRQNGECIWDRQMPAPATKGKGEAGDDQLFSVIEYSSFFAVRHNPSGKEHPMGDGVDSLFDQDGEPLCPGTDGFTEAWEDALNETPEETLEAYFPHFLDD